MRETENKIILSKSNEFCILDAGDRRNAFLWVNKICKNCGFDEITNNNNQLVANSKQKQKKTNVNSTNSSLHEDSSSEATKNMSLTIQNNNNNNNNSISSTSNFNKPVAGIAALSVGSFHMKLDNIFKKKPNDNNSNKPKLKLSKSETENIKENYVFLQDFMSGLDKTTNNTNNMFHSFNSLNNNENNGKQLINLKRHGLGTITHRIRVKPLRAQSRYFYCSRILELKIKK